MGIYIVACDGEINTCAFFAISYYWERLIEGLGRGLSEFSAP